MKQNGTDLRDRHLEKEVSDHAHVIQFMCRSIIRPLLSAYLHFLLALANLPA